MAMARHGEGRRWVVVLAGVRRAGRSVARMRVQKGHVTYARLGSLVQRSCEGAGLQTSATAELQRQDADVRGPGSKVHHGLN